MSPQKDILDKAIARVLDLMEKYNVSEEDKVSIEEVIEAHRARVDSYDSIDVHSETERLYMYIHRSSNDVEQRMMLSEKELWTPYTI